MRHDKSLEVGERQKKGRWRGTKPQILREKLERELLK